MTEDPIICYCFGTRRDAVRRHFSKPEARLEDLIAETSITTKCTACTLDLDVLLDDIQSSERLAGPRATAIEAESAGWPNRIERVDSGFLICDDKITTHIRLANYPPNFDSPELCTPHDWKLKIFDNDGRVRKTAAGRIGVGEEIGIELAELGDCPAQGWFLLRLFPNGPGHYGTVRPQAALQGEDWVACYHTQFHTDASREGRRSGTPLRTVGGFTHAVVSIINGASKPATWQATMEGDGRTRTVEGRLAGDGACMLGVDAAFPGLPDSASLILRVRSSRPTRKNLINRHPDGSLGVDHFPNLV